METKHFLASKTFWGAVIAIVAAIGSDALAMRLPSPDEIVVVIGGVIAIIGRFTAKKAITAA